MPDKQDENENWMQNRRELLASAGTISALPLSIPQSASASSNGQPFVEIGIQHRDVPDFPPSHTDNFAPYRYNPHEEVVYVSKTVTEEQERKFRGDKPLVCVNGQSIYEAPTTVTGPNPQMLLPVKRGYRMKLEEKYQGPKPRVRFDGTTAIVSIANRSLKLHTHSAETLELEPRNAKGRINNGGGEAKPRSVTPVITVRNLGEVPIVQPQSEGG